MAREGSLNHATLDKLDGLFERAFKKLDEAYEAMNKASIVLETLRGGK